MLDYGLSVYNCNRRLNVFADEVARCFIHH